MKAEKETTTNIEQSNGYETISGAEALLRCLVEEGVDTIFGIPGIHTLSLYDEISKHKTLRHILVKHEQSAVFSALGYALTTNRNGVALVVPGPGVLNTVSAVAEAYYQHKPIVLVL